MEAGQNERLRHAPFVYEMASMRRERKWVGVKRIPFPFPFPFPCYR